MTPKFHHDCGACTFLGPFGDSDLYHCPQHGNPTLVVRYSSKGPDYSSFSADTMRSLGGCASVALQEAYKRAKARRLPLGG